jgi:hypothetical protein
MTREAVILSVPHTGTRFLKERLGIEHHVHANSGWMGMYDFCLDREAIYVPLRRPHEVWRSWCRRHYGREPLEWAGQFFAGWFNVNALSKLFPVEFIAVDRPGHPLIDDWTRVGQFEGRATDWKLHKCDLRIIYTLPYIVDIYGRHTGD